MEKEEAGIPDVNRFIRQPWASWSAALQANSLPIPKTEDTNLIRDNRVNRLPRQDMSLYGICPLKENFSAVLCSICGSVVKPQALLRHVLLKHPTDSETVLLPPPQVPVKKTKTASVKMKKESNSMMASSHSTSSSSSSSSSSTNNNSNSSNSNTSETMVVPPVVSTNITKTKVNHDTENVKRSTPDRKAQKSRERDRECDTTTENNNSSKSSSRRTVTGKSNLNKIVAEQPPQQPTTVSQRERNTKDQSSLNTNTSSSNSKSRSHSILKPVVVSETNDQSSQKFPTNPSSDTSTILVCEPAPSPTPSSTPTPVPTPTLTPTVLTTTTWPNSPTQGIPSPPLTSSNGSDYTATQTTTTSSSSNSSACSSPSLNSSHDSIQPDVIRIHTPTTAPPTTTASLTFSNDKGSIYTVKLPSSPVIFVSGNAESPSDVSSPSPPTIQLQPTNKAIVVPRNLIESLNVPVVVQMPQLPDISNLHLYTAYPKPLVMSEFSTKKIGHALFIRNRRLEYVRNQFRSVLKKDRMRPITNQSENQKNTNNTNIRYLNKIGNNSSNVGLAHRPNILRATGGAATVTKTRNRAEQIAVKRPATNQITGLDCKHMVLTPTTANNISGIIGKMIVHQHDVVTDSNDGPGANHLSLDVPVNIQ